MLLAWIFFRATDFGKAWTMAKAWLFCGAAGQKEVWIMSPVPSWGLALRFGIVLTPLMALHLLANANCQLWLRRHLPSWVVTLLFGVIAAMALSLVPLAARPFIYFQF